MRCISTNSILRFLESERDHFYYLAQKYARIMANAELSLDSIGYREADRLRMQYDHYAEAMQLIIKHLKFHYDYDGVKSDD